MTVPNPFKVLPGEPIYAEAVDTEVRAWSSVRRPNPQDHPLRVAYQNEVVTSDSRKDVLRWLAENYGPFDNAVSLGCGNGRIERKLLEMGALSRLWACDASASALEEFRAACPGTVSLQTADLNFLELPKDTFDLVIVWEAMHHVINIEHLLYQIACSLRSGGLFMIRDFVGETRWQWTALKRRAAKEVVERIRAVVPTAPIRPPRRHVDFQMSPFESVRSGDIVAQVRNVFSDALILERQWEPLCHDALGLVDYQLPGPLTERSLEMLIAADREFLTSPECQGIQPCTLFALSRRPSRVIVPCVRAWSPRELQEHLDSSRYLSANRRLRIWAKRWTHQWPEGKSAWGKAACLVHGLEHKRGRRA